MKTKILTDFQICISVSLKTSIKKNTCKFKIGKINRRNNLLKASCSTMYYITKKKRSVYP